MDTYRITSAVNWLRTRANMLNALSAPVPAADVTYIREEILLIAKAVEKEEPISCRQLLEVKDLLFYENRVNWNMVFIHINPYAFGQAIGILDNLVAKGIDTNKDWWSFVHPAIRRVSEKLYLDGSYANAACDAFIEINDRVKKLYQKIRPGEQVPDGDKAMKTIFSANSPLIAFCDQTDDTGFNIQKGFMEMLAGAMSALRNPKAHANITIDKNDAMRRLMFASMLMYKIDDAVQYSNIRE